MRSGSLTGRIERIERDLSYYGQSSYTIERPIGEGLYINFKNGIQVKLPIVPPRPYQKEVYKGIFEDGINRAFLVWPRRSGKEVTSWEIVLERAIMYPGLHFMIYPTNVRARMVLWDGSIVLPDGGSMKFRDMIPKILLAGKPNDQEMTIKLTNGSVIKILGSDVDPDKLRGTNPRTAVFSEYAFSDPRVYQILMPVFRQNGGLIILQTTYNGMNHAYRLMKEVKDNPQWLCREESVETLVDENGNRYVTDEMIDEDRKSGMAEFLIQQEYYSLVTLNEESIYFSVEINAIYESNRLRDGVILPGTPVWCAYDLGMNDMTSVIIFQKSETGFNIIHYFENNNKKIEYYITEVRKFCSKHNLLLKCSFIPHDGANKSNQTGLNMAQYAAQLGEDFVIVQRPVSKIMAIQSMRNMLYKVTFEKSETLRLIECLSNYSKEFDAKYNRYKDSPRHDWTSHAVDSFQTMTLAADAGMINSVQTDVFYYEN